jgi:hypothetical protein
MNIVHISDDIKQEFHIDPDGKTFVTVNAAAQILGITRQGLQQNCNSNKISSRFGQYLSKSGIENVNFSEKGISDVALAIIAKYYAYKSNKKSEQAEQFDLAMSAIGIRTWIQSELGYQKQKQPIEPPKQQLEDLTEVQLKGLVIFAGCSKSADRELDKSELLKGIDPIFWNLSVNACMALLKQRQLEDLLFLEPLNLLTVELEYKDDPDQFKLLSTKQLILGDTKRVRDAVNNETLVKALEVAKLTLPESHIREPIALSASSKSKGFGKSQKRGGSK